MEPTTLLLLLLFLVLGYIIGKALTHMQWMKKLPGVRKDSVGRSRATLTGQFSEQIAPYLPGFKYSPTELRFIGKPVDFIVFEGMDQKDIQKVTFLEVKSGDSKLSSQEKKLKEVIESGEVYWDEYRAELPNQKVKNRNYFSN